MLEHFEQAHFGRQVLQTGIFTNLMRNFEKNTDIGSQTDVSYTCYAHNIRHNLSSEPTKTSLVDEFTK